MQGQALDLKSKLLAETAPGGLFSGALVKISKGSKQTIYRVVDPVSTANELNSIPINSIFKAANEFIFDTKFGNNIEEAGVKAKSGEWLVKGPIGEIYKIGDNSKLNAKYQIQEDGTYKPKGRPLDAIEITKDIFNWMKEQPEIVEGSDDGLQFPVLYGGVNYGGTHLLRVRDFIVVEGSDFYRVFRPAWNSTYNRVNANGNVIIGGSRKTRSRVSRKTGSNSRSKRSKYIKKGRYYKN